jgi:hypothetical protein
MGRSGPPVWCICTDGGSCRWNLPKCSVQHCVCSSKYGRSPVGWNPGIGVCGNCLAIIFIHVLMISEHNHELFSKIESICYCGKPDVFQNMVGCEAKRGRVKCSKWYTRVVQGFQGIGFVMNCWFCYMYWYFNCIIFKWITCWCLECLIFCFMYFYWTWVIFTCEIK